MASDPGRGGWTATAFFVAASAIAGALALIVPSLAMGHAMPGMPMTHYMGLLSLHQPWNLLLFMALPVVLAETLAITELALLFSPPGAAWVRATSRWAGVLAGPVWVFITLHLLLNVVLPLSATHGWRGPADVIAVLAYLAGSVPMLGVSLLELGLLGGTGRSWTRLHVVFVAAFLVVAHVAMIFGMVDPTLFGWRDPSGLPMNHGAPLQPTPTPTR